ncbi:hypothetical protein [Acidithrix sp. C25]|uniref:glycosyl-4,4'-diaponeurosporenoate acyltransferase CrtO family protein n=1 Tax=Acidithrix sp. C25 TaxID=1671482 RepID=UPI00191BC5CB|nr:hypothetical protein [Acidithrix sp. C25]
MKLPFHGLWALVVIDSIYWLSMSFLVGFIASKIPLRWLSPRLERLSGRSLSDRISFLRMRTRVDRWKSYLPEAGGFFGGGVSKSHLGSRDLDGMKAMQKEFVRASFVHQILIILWIFPFFFNPYWMGVTMGIYVFFANVPCLLSIKFSTYRFELLLRKIESKGS